MKQALYNVWPLGGPLLSGGNRIRVDPKFVKPDKNIVFTHAYYRYFSGITKNYCILTEN